MSDLTLQQLQDMYKDYFSVDHAISLNVKPLESNPPDMAQLLANIPPPFLLSSDVNSLSTAALRSLNRLGELADELALYLNAQAKKIDLLLHYVLRQQDDSSNRFISTQFGGSGCAYMSAFPLEIMQTVELKLFLDNNDGAVFCYGQVISCEKQDERWLIKVVFCTIRDEDRELLVRASLHQQSRLLKLKAEQRQQQAAQPE